MYMILVTKLALTTRHQGARRSLVLLLVEAKNVS